MSKPALCVVFSAAGLLGQDARHIVEESQNRARSASQQYEGTLDIAGAPAKTKHWIYKRMGSAGNSKTILRFTAPSELTGVALLIVSHPGRETEQWMWTPALERERRIAPQDRSSRFFGTDFSFEDLEERDLDQFDYRLRGEEAVDGAPCWKIESKPKDPKSSQYSMALLYIRKDNYIAAQIENFVADRLVRRIRYTDIQKVDNIWTPRTIEVFDTSRNSRTVLKLEKLQYNAPLKDEDFALTSR